jgi:hypothetical protein
MQISCGFGCGQPAMTQLKNGRWICAAFPAQCPVLREHNGAKHRGRNPFEGRDHPRGMAGKPAWNRGRKLEECHDATTVERLRECARQNAALVHARWDPRSASEQRRRAKLSQIAKERGLGRYRPGSGRGKPVHLRRPRQVLDPRFSLERRPVHRDQGLLLAPGGGQVRGFPHRLLVIRRHNLQFVFDHVVEHYGRNFTRLYE